LKEETRRETVSGKLYLVGTPLGNLEDITFRALRILAEVDLIAAEDTRRTLKLLNHYRIKKRLLSYHRHNEEMRANELLAGLATGQNIALVSDAGMPGISDPGNFLVAEAVKKGLTIIPVPGPTAVTAALAASGLDTGSFTFQGFLPRKEKDRTETLKRLANLQDTLVFYEAPHRLVKTLQNLKNFFGNRPAVLARELTKIHEEFLRGNLTELYERVKDGDVIGEFTIVIAGAVNSGKKIENTADNCKELFTGMGIEGKSLKEELKVIAKKTGKSTKEIYRRYLEYKNSTTDYKPK